MANVKDVALFFVDVAQKRAEADGGDKMTNLRLQKLLYFSQGWHLARYGKPLFMDEIEAWKLGPVVPAAYRHFKKYGNNCIETTEDFDQARLTEQEMELLTDVYAGYADYSTSRLVDMTHERGTPWARVHNPEKQQNVITSDMMREFFASEKKLPDIDDLLERIPVESFEQDENGIPIVPASWDDD